MAAPKASLGPILVALTLSVVALPADCQAANQSQPPAGSQDISGVWQNTPIPGSMRTAFKIEKSASSYTATMYSIDVGVSVPVTTISQDGAAVKFSIAPLQGHYEGTLAADGKSMTGLWSQGGGTPVTLDLVRPTKEDAWELPDPARGHTQVALAAKILDSYAGRYQLGPQALTISHDADHLKLTPPGGAVALDLYPESTKDFFAKALPIQISFDMDPQGNVTQLVMHQGARDVAAKRITELSDEALKSRLVEIDAMVAAAYAKAPIGSVTVGVVHGSELVWTKSYGYSDMENKALADKDTVYRIGSITKMFTAVMLEQLADAGKVHLSDPVEKYLPEVNTVQGRIADAPQITLMQLATHTSGMGREPDDTATYVQGPIASWEKTLLAALPHTHYVFEPGTRFIYSNMGYATLGATLARAAGQPYTEYVPQHIFMPLGMTHTALDPTPEMLTHLSKGYVVTGAQYDSTGAQQELKGRGYKVPNGAIFTTVGDMAHFASFLMGQGPETVLKTASLMRYQNQLEVPADSNLMSGYGIGFMAMRRDNYVALGHGGDVTGYQAALFVNRDRGVGLVVLANALGNGSVITQDIAMKALDALSK